MLMWTRSAERVLDHLRPKPIPDTQTHELVRAKLVLVCAHPERIAVGVEHGCVTLAGAIATHERARAVRAIAKVRGVDSVVDLLHEKNDDVVHERRWSRALRIAAAGSGVGLAVAGLRLGGGIGLTLAILGAFLAVGGTTGVSRVVVT
jgi:hypothetical protein